MHSFMCSRVKSSPRDKTPARFPASGHFCMGTQVRPKRFQKQYKHGTYNIMPLTAAPDDLRRHILDGTAEGVSPVLTAAELLGETEVCQHDVTFRVQEDILQFDVTVDYAELVEEIDD